MASSIHPYRCDSDELNKATQQASRERIETLIAAELQWLDGAEGEPPWPELPAWLSRRRRGIRIGSWTAEDDDELNEEKPDHYVDENALGALVGHLIRLTVGELPPWLSALAAHFMRWTDKANGPHGEEDGDRDHRPNTWNTQFFEFLGILCVALPHDDVVAMFLEPITRFKDEAFHDATAAFLCGFDRAMQAIDTTKPENPVAVRALLAGRIRKCRNFERIGREKGFRSETHAGAALNAMFYQPPYFANRGLPSTPNNWDGLEGSAPTLTALVNAAPASGYLATLLLNLFETSPRAVLLPFLAQAATGWCSAYGVDTNFWSEKGIGGRVCGWLDRTFDADLTSVVVVPTVAEDLLKCLDILVRSGVAHASEIEGRIVGMTTGRENRLVRDR